MEVPYPDDGAVGDLILVFAGDNKGTVAAIGPDSFTPIPGAQSDRTDFNSSVVYRAADGTEAASIILAAGPVGEMRGLIALRYRPAKLSPIAVSAVNDDQQSGTLSPPHSVLAPSLDVPTAGRLVCCWALREHDVIWETGGEGMEVRQSFRQTGSPSVADIAMQASDQMVPAGPTSHRTAMYSYGSGQHGDAAWGASLILR